MDCMRREPSGSVDKLIPVLPRSFLGLTRVLPCWRRGGKLQLHSLELPVTAETWERWLGRKLTAGRLTYPSVCGSMNLQEGVWVSSPPEKTMLLPGIHATNVKTYSHEHLCVDISSSFMHDCQNVASTKMSFRRWTDKWPVCHPDNGTFFQG